jgi:hypothetical protein
MAKLTLSEAARACNVARTTIQRAVKSGRLSLDAEHRIDTAELLRIGYQVDAAPPYSTPQQQSVASQEAQLLRQERGALQRERDLLMQQMLHEMQHRYDRLLEAPRSSAPPARPALDAQRKPKPGSLPSPVDPRRDMRRRIVDLLREHPEGLTPAEIRDLLGVDRSLTDTCIGMLRYGLVQRVERGRYSAPAPPQPHEP